jgi:hypothetical protein
MQGAIERRLGHLEKLIPLPLIYERFTARVSEHAARYGASPGSALVTVIEDLSERQIDLLLEELDGKFDVRRDIESPESIRLGAIEAGFSPADAELLVRHVGQPE